MPCAVRITVNGTEFVRSGHNLIAPKGDRSALLNENARAVVEVIFTFFHLTNGYNGPISRRTPLKIDRKLEIEIRFLRESKHGNLIRFVFARVCVLFYVVYSL